MKIPMPYRRPLIRFLSATLFAVLSMFAWAGYLQYSGNVHEIEPSQFYRSAQLNGDEFKNIIKEKGIRTVINLRGENIGSDWYDAEIAAVRETGAHHIDIRLSANNKPDAETLNALIKALRTAPRPLLVHCKAGADRTGLASALYEYLVENKTAKTASGQLSFRYGHFPWLWSDTVAMDKTFFEITERDKLPSELVPVHLNKTASP